MSARYRPLAALLTFFMSSILHDMYTGITMGFFLPVFMIIYAVNGGNKWSSLLVIVCSTIHIECNLETAGCMLISKHILMQMCGHITYYGSYTYILSCGANVDFCFLITGVILMSGAKFSHFMTYLTLVLGWSGFEIIYYTELAARHYCPASDIGKFELRSIYCYYKHNF